jgi:A/G-specific adenine glycosylase
MWAGLGYYSRARNLHKCAKVVMEQHGGRFPMSEAVLMELPGIGPYTASAIAAIAFGEKSTPLDGNVERVVARLFAVTEPLPGSKPTLKRLGATLTPAHRPGDFAQATMDLGATICTPKRPSCLMCPISHQCLGHAAGIERQLPARAVRGERPSRYGVAFLTLREDGYVLLRKRPETGLLARMMEVPSTEWLDDVRPGSEALQAQPVRADWWLVPGSVSHTFTHFRLELLVYRAVVPSESSLTFWADAARCSWIARRDLHRQALPSLMRKVIAHGLKEM